MIAKRIKINVYQDKTIEPSTFVIANQHENGVTEVKFDICSGLLRKSYFYYALLVSPNAKCQYVVPLTDDKSWTVTSAMTKMAGTWGLHLLIKDIEMVDGINVSDGIVFISNRIEAIVRKNDLNLEILESQGLPEELQIVYDQLQVALEQANDAIKRAEEIASGAVAAIDRITEPDIDKITE